MMFSAARKSMCVFILSSGIGWVYWIQVNSMIFFFLAEDGIRGAQESRWLGEEYKKQGVGRCSY